MGVGQLGVSELFDDSTLMLVELHQLKGLGISPGHLFYQMKEKNFLLLKAGDFISNDFIKKYENKGVTQFALCEVAKSEHINLMTQRWNELFSAKSYKQSQLAKKNILKLFYDWFWSSSRQSVHYYTLINSTFKSLHRFSEEQLCQLDAINTDDLVRSLHVGALATIIALISGITDKKILSDVYHAAALLDVSLFLDQYSYRIKEVCELERLNPRSAREFLETMVERERRSLYRDHPKKSSEVALDKFENCFYDKEMVRVIAFHHEYIDGSGLSKKIKYQSCSDWEASIIVADRMIPYRGELFVCQEGDGIYQGLLHHLMKSKVYTLLPIDRIVSLIQGEESRMDKVG